MVVGSPAHKKAVQSLWVGKATITVLDGVLNPANGRTEPQERILAADIRCRISHKSVVSTEPNEEAAQVAQSVVLYIDPSVDIPEGSKITVTQNGMTRDYERSGKSAVYKAERRSPRRPPALLSCPNAEKRTKQAANSTAHFVRSYNFTSLL